MNPVICFYENDLMLHSEDYLRLECDYRKNSTEFLNQVQLEYPMQMKVIQVNFDYLQKQNIDSLVDQDAAITVYVLNNYKLINKIDFISQTEKIDFNFIPKMTKNDFMEKVKIIRSDIQNGRYYQVNLTSNFQSQIKVKTPPYELFKYYLGKFEAEYSAFLPRLNSEILCYSPELFLEKKDAKILTRPIKGTNQSSQPFNDLLKNEKENAELSMIVDLLRNDLQSICQDKVVVSEHRKELTLNYLTHTYSEIVGHTDQRLPEILEKMLPAGSISGCPKKESLIAINELETTNRHFYTGCIGWWQNQDFKLNLAIRSFLNQKGHLTYFSGCGIVYDSDPEKEWFEFLRKAKHLELNHD
ncbi:MAG: chorismate-binding protein [Bdellovibrionaceae bacterium]|nr:chorismate-binding protein [Pseudobdellovibrionaceae bacterium]